MLSSKTTIDNKYKIEKRIGRGRFAEVYRAIDERLNREVAIKHIPVDEGMDTNAKQAVEEATLLASLNHPNIITLWDIVVEKENIYLIMEYARGGTLRKLMNQKAKLPEREALDIIAQICLGLGHAHEKGIIHRDLKPENIFLNEGHWKIGDLGLGRILQGSQRASSTGTGTVAYNAPERFRPGYDKRADIWSVGVMLFEMLTGKLPFSGEDEVQLMFSICSDETTIPNFVSSKSRGLLKKLLAKSTQDRYISADQIIQDIKSENRESIHEIIIPAKTISSIPTVPQHKSGETRILTAGIEFVFVKGGEFNMGSNESETQNDEKPVHKVYVDDFYISKYEVTFDQYDNFCEATGREKPSDNGWGRGNRPVINVNWFDTVAYCEWLSDKSGTEIRLPTEAEWEYAACGGIKSMNYKYSGSNDLEEVGWYSKNSGKKTHPVGQKKANELGLYDMSGNVWEWCSDWYEKDYYQNSPRNNPQGSNSGKYRVLRGGSWNYIDWYCRCSYRDVSIRSFGSPSIGFRIIQGSPL